MFDLVGNLEDQFSRIVAHICGFLTTAVIHILAFLNFSLLDS